MSTTRKMNFSKYSTFGEVLKVLGKLFPKLPKARITTSYLAVTKNSLL